MQVDFSLFFFFSFFLFFLSFCFQVLGESLYLSGKYLAYEEKLASFISQMESLSLENALLQDKVTSLESEAKEIQECLKALEKDISTKKAFSRLKDKKIEEVLAKISKASAEAVEKFKDSDEYSNKLCDYYVEGFDIFRKYLARHHPELDFSKLDMEKVEKEILVDHPFKAIVENEDVMEEATAKALADPSPSNFP